MCWVFVQTDIHAEFITHEKVYSVYTIPIYSYHNCSALYSMPPPFSFILPTHSFVCSDWLRAQSYD